jgi:hypothetical protein
MREEFGSNMGLVTGCADWSAVVFLSTNNEML